MNRRLFVANLPWNIDDNRLRDLFAQYGEIVMARVITDRESGKSRGFGFVEFSSSVDAGNALEMNDEDVAGRKIVVKIAKPIERKPFEK